MDAASWALPSNGIAGQIRRGWNPLMRIGRMGVRMAVALGALGVASVAALALPRRGTPRTAAPRSDPPMGAGAADAGRPATGDPSRAAQTRGGAPPAPREGLPLDFLLLVLALSIPFWLLGGGRLPIPVRLPVSALIFVNPVIAASIVTYRRHGPSGLRALFRRAADYRRVRDKRWYLPALLLYPLIMVLSYGVMRLARRPLPEPRIAWQTAPLYLLAFLVAGAAEELGWTGYATDPMQRRWGALRTGVVLGLAWSVFHLVPDIQNRQPVGWIVWQRLNTVAFRILIVWVYNNAGRSVFVATLFHAVNNVSWALFPNAGSHYDPLVTFMVTLPVVGFVVAGWDPETLTRFRLARTRRRR